MNVAAVYAGSDGALTRRFYAELEQCGPVGLVALNLFRAQKCSARAKVYRGGVRGVGSYRGMAYERKNWSMHNLCRMLSTHGPALGITWGWKKDPMQSFHNWVLYVDLPGGQVSFHSAERLDGPDYSADWDRQRKSAERIIEFCDAVLSTREQTLMLPLEAEHAEA
jgi:hypothetical protein